jgi:FkbM family methyltransferase
MAVCFSRVVGEDGCVIAVEAHPFLHALLTRNLALNGCTNAQAIFGAAFRRGGESVRYPEPRFWRYPSYGSYGIDPGPGRGPRVPTVALDELAPPQRVDFLKIDAQGSDLDVLRGARALIKRDGMPILFEYSPEFDAAFGNTFRDYETFIATIGYRITERIGDNILIERDPATSASL